MNVSTAMIWNPSIVRIPRCSRASAIAARSRPAAGTGRRVPSGSPRAVAIVIAINANSALLTNRAAIVPPTTTTAALIAGPAK